MYVKRWFVDNFPSSVQCKETSPMGTFTGVTRATCHAPRGKLSLA